MAEDEPPAEEPTTGDEHRPSDWRARPSARGSPPRRRRDTTKAPDADDAADEADKTDMGAVGDDGQVFGG